MSSKPTAIGVDIGGSSTKIGLVAEDGEILFRAIQPTPSDLPGETHMRAILGKLSELVHWAGKNGFRPQGIGVSVCGYLDESGDQPDYINLHALDHYPVSSRLREAFSLPVVLDNDMNCGVLGEYVFGAGKGVDRLMVMTVGTGIGMSVVLNGEVFRRSAGTVGNPGHIIVQPDGPVCPAGCRGCLESVASSGPISRRAEDLARSQRSTALAAMLAAKDRLTPEDLYQAAESGDIAAQETWLEVGAWLGRGLASWVEIFTPEVVIVGGGVAKAGHWLVDPIEAEMRRVGEPHFTRRVRKVKQSQLGQELAMLGAASFYLYPEYAPHWNMGRAA
jgi:glucokinase